METVTTKTNQFISQAKAKQLIKKFKNEKDKIVKDEFKDKHILPFSETFDRSFIDALLKLPGCVKLRVYFGMEEDDKVSLVLVGVDENGKDILTPITSSESGMPEVTIAGEIDPIVENGAKCPPDCPIDSPLNS